MDSLRNPEGTLVRSDRPGAENQPTPEGSTRSKATKELSPEQAIKKLAKLREQSKAGTLTGASFDRQVDELLARVNPLAKSPVRDVSVTMDEPKSVQTRVGPTKYRWEEIEPQMTKLNLTKELIEKTGNMQNLLNGSKTTLLPITETSKNNSVRQAQAKIYVIHLPSGELNVEYQKKKLQINLPDFYLGHRFTDTDKKNLHETGNMGRRVALIDTKTHQPFQGFIGIDPDTLNLTTARMERVAKILPDIHQGVTLSPQQKSAILQGFKTTVRGMTNQNGTVYDGTVQVNVHTRNIETRRLLPSTAAKQAPVAEQKPVVSSGLDRNEDALKATNVVLPSPDQEQTRKTPRR